MVSLSAVIALQGAQFTGCDIGFATFALELFDVPVVLEEMLVFLPMIFLAAALLTLPFHAGAGFLDGAFRRFH